MSRPHRRREARVQCCGTVPGDGTVPRSTVSNVSVSSQGRSPAWWPPAAGYWLAAAGATGRTCCTVPESCLPSDERVPYTFAVAFVASTIEILIADAVFIASI